MIVDTVDPWQTDTLDGAVTVGTGLTVMLKLFWGPAHVTELFVNCGMTVTVPLFRFRTTVPGSHQL